MCLTREGGGEAAEGPGQQGEKRLMGKLDEGGSTDLTHKSHKHRGAGAFRCFRMHEALIFTYIHCPFCPAAVWN